MKEVSLRELLEAGCHFGHQTTRWNPKMKPYIFAARDRIHIFDLVKTKAGMEKAGAFIKEIVANGDQILFVGTKRQSQEIIKTSAEKVVMPYMTERWIGGLLTNWDMMKGRLKHLADMKKGREDGSFLKTRTKKENLLIDREILKMMHIFGGIIDLKGVPKAIFVADAKKDNAAIQEANRCGAKVIALADTNVNPDGIDFIIPANDDAAKSIQLIVDYIAEAVEEGKLEKVNKELRTKNEGEKKIEMGSEGEKREVGEKVEKGEVEKKVISEEKKKEEKPKKAIVKKAAKKEVKKEGK